MKRSVLAAAAAAAVLLAACGPSESPRATIDDGAARVPSNEPLARVVHALPGAPGADVYAGSAKKWDDVAFGDVTPYQPLPTEKFQLALKPAEPDNAPSMIEAEQTVKAGHRYTILALPDADGAGTLEVLTDDTEPPAPGKAKVRVIHAAPEAGEVEIRSAGAESDAVVGGLSFGSTASYEEVDAAAVSVVVQSKAPATKQARIGEYPVQLDAGKVYTLVVAAGGEAGKPVELIQIVEGESEVAKPPVMDKQPALQREPGADYEIQPDVDVLRRQQQEESKK
jgi:hypothetical protein